VDRKRKLPLLVVLVAALGLSIAAAGCGGDEEGAPPAPAEPPAAGDISIGLVTDTGGVDDRGFNQFSIAGLEQAAADFGFETRVYVSESAEDYLPNLTAAAEDGHALVFAVGFLLTPDTLTPRSSPPACWRPSAARSSRSASSAALPRT
jgi:basic membrane protein A